MPHSSTKKILLSLSIAAALGAASGTTFADGDDITALEARIAELEAMVRQLMAERTEAPAPAVDCCGDMDAKAKAAADAAIAAYKAEEEEKAKKHSYAFGGYVKSDVIYSNYSDGSYSGAGRDFYIPGTIPVAQGDGFGESYLDFHVKESRINFKSNHLLDSGDKLGTFIEFDMMLSGQGDERISNSYAPRVRHAFITYNNWLFGQTWMTFFNVGALPENLDFVGPAESTVFGRQAMIRYTAGPWQFAVENPETTVSNYQAGGRIVTDDNKIPDFVARYNMKGDWGAISIAGIMRQLRYENRTAGGPHDSISGYGISVSGKHMLGSKDDFRWMATYGEGIGRYVGLNTANDAVLDAAGNLDAIGTSSAFASFRHFWSEKWRSNFTLGYLSVDNDVSLTGGGVTKNASSMHVNLIYNPLPKLDFGVELMYADRETENGADGDMTRMMFSAKYGF
jgi:hypothetical protein